jgi:HK97 family phage major capsid protein
MKFTYKAESDLAAMTGEQRDIYSEQKRAFEQEATEKMIIDAIAKAFPMETPEEIKAKTDAIALEKAQFSEMKEAINQMKENGFGASNGDSFGKQVSDAIKSNFDKIKSLFSSGSGVVEFEIKAVADITTGNGTNTAPPSITGVQQAGLSNINLRQIPVLDMTSNVNTSLAAYPYTEVKPKDGDYSFLAEGAVKPQIDFNWETNYAKPVKAAAWIRLTEESLKDVAGLESIAKDYLLKKHNLKKSRGILFGDGISPNPKGVTTYGRVFSAGPLALGVVNPNFMDVVNACITDISTTHNYEDEMPYMANLVLVNPNDFFINLVAAKDLNGLPLYPMASLFNKVVIGGVTIIPEESITAGKIFVGDMSKYNTTNYVPYTVKIGWVNDDFIKNQFVILAESRFHAFVKKMDEQAFIYDNFATIKTAITKP